MHGWLAGWLELAPDLEQLDGAAKSAKGFLGHTNSTLVYSNCWSREMNKTSTTSGQIPSGGIQVWLEL